jgi:hypothetical protein
MKTSELTGPALDWAVAKCEGVSFTHGDNEYELDGRVFQRGGCSVERRYSTSWDLGGPIIDWMMMEGVTFSVSVDGWVTARFCTENRTYKGDTLLIAAMRCCVAYKLGDEIDIPEELL